MDLLGRAFAVWFGIAILAVLNGGFREVILIPKLGERAGHILSTLLLSATIMVVAFLSIRWIGIPSLASAWAVAAGWLVLTLLFETIAGHYLFGNPWEKIFADYRVSHGRVWILIPFTILFAGPIAHQGLAQKWLVPYAVSNLVAAAMLLLAGLRPHVARWAFVVLFTYAGIYNTWLSINRPLEYQGFADLALIPWYRTYVTETLKSNAQIITAIGIGQLCIAGAWALGRRCLALGAFGGCVFLLAIAPLGVGSAAPFSFTVSLAMIVVALHKASS
ncbi:MAG: hypothetical protein JNK63_03955 [Chthonomonas sp.]|nr:hypothetical protein [Chthonomonas sp.]